MALRVTRPTARVTNADPRASAAALLAREDWAGLRQLFADAADEPGTHGTYKARKAIIEACLTGSPREAPKTVATRFAATAGLALDALEADPREPIFLNYAGVALYELGSWTAAESLFKAALRLSPTLPHLRDNLKALDARRRSGRQVPVPATISVALGALAKRAERCASAARPAEGLTLSLCMIVRDEEEMLPRSLAAARDAVDEIIVVDTGSTDRTVEIAKSFGAKVIEREWTGSFADARNASFDAATGDWIMYLDADEVLVAGDAERLREITGRTWREAFYLVETNFTGELGDGTAVTHNALRVFRNRPEYRFEGRIHEQIAHKLPTKMPERIEVTDVRVEHYGYLGVVRDAKDKSRRNIELLERQRDEAEDPTAFLHFNLGSEYAALGENGSALDSFEKAWELMREDPERAAYGYVPSLLSRLVRARRVNGLHEEAGELAVEALDMLPGFTDLVYERAQSAREMGKLSEAAALLGRCLEMGDAPSRYSATAGAGTYLALCSLARIHREQGDDAAASAVLARCLDEHPGYLGAVGPYATALLAEGVAPETVVEDVTNRTPQLTPSARFLLATALYEAGHAAAAEEHFAAVAEAQPTNAGARVALAESLLSQRRWTEAAEIAAGVEDGAPFAAAARRTELFGRIVAGEADLAEQASLRAAADLPAGDRAAYDAWRRLAAGEIPGPAPAGAVPALVVALEALLRVEELDAVAPVIAAIEGAALPKRDRHELLAGAYLRRGFLESATDEWIAACDERGPDADALVGLAQVAWARGMYEDAVVFAREAESLDPKHALASGLAARLAATAAERSSSSPIGGR
jgi:glycosyltransferase involved in cell wall biosynthesis